jgi:hypothetical protein
MQGLLHPAEGNPGYFLVWCQSLQLPSTQFQSPLALSPLAPKSHASLQNTYSTVNTVLHFSQLDPD